MPPHLLCRYSSVHFHLKFYTLSILKLFRGCVYLLLAKQSKSFFDGVLSTFIISNSILLLFCFFSSDLFQNRLMVAVENHLAKYIKTKNPNQRGCKSLWDFVCRQNEDSKRTIDNQTELQPVLILQI